MENMTGFSLFVVYINSYKQKAEYIKWGAFIVDQSMSQRTEEHWTTLDQYSGQFTTPVVYHFFKENTNFANWGQPL